MKMAEIRRENLVTLCQSISLPASLIAQYCRTLLQEAADSFNAEQINDIDIMRKNAELLVSVVAEVNQAHELGTYRRMSPEEFAHFAHTLLHDLRSRAGLISGFSDMSLEGTTGELKENLKATLEHIHQLSQIILSAFADYETASEPFNL